MELDPRTLMPVFSIGDQVILTSKRHIDAPYNPIWGGKFGRIAGTVNFALATPTSGPIYQVVWQNSYANSYVQGDLELCPPVDPEVDAKFKKLFNLK